MAIVTAEESRAGSRDIYLPPHERGMAHRSYPSPDGKSILVVEMNERGDFVPCRLLPVDGKSQGKQVGPPGACVHLCRMVTRWGMDVLQFQRGRRLPYLAPAFSRWRSRSRSPRDLRKRKGSPWRPTAARSLRPSE